MKLVVSIKKILIVILVFYSVPLVSLRSAVTYGFSGGRLGDCLLSYAHAKWIAYKFNMPLLYKPFNYSDQLVMHRDEIYYSTDLEEQFNNVVEYHKDSEIDVEAGILYIVPFFPESIFNRYDQIFPFLFEVDWDEIDFKHMLAQMIRPLNGASKSIPSQTCTVALHVRKGTGWDIPNYRITPQELSASHPLRFAPDSFYVNQLKKMVRMFPHDQIDVYLFTDHDNPKELADLYYKSVNCERMNIHYRLSENNEFVNVLEDFFSLMQCKCLIRADSNFSFMAARLTEFMVEIAPWHGVVIDGETFIDEISMKIGLQTLIVKD